ncbi:MAG: phospholipase D family protein [Bacteroidales bacterium]
MKLITTSASLKSNFLRLLDSYKEYYWLTAWAGVEPDILEALSNNKKRIKQIVAGLHFYQTHPDFIKTFLDTETVKYIKQTQGTFHPKMYLFYNSDDEWEVLIGSANLTKPAFNNNTEISTIITAEDANGDFNLSRILKEIDSVWNEASLFTEKELSDYRKAWKDHKPKIIVFQEIMEIMRKHI